MRSKRLRNARPLLLLFATTLIPFPAPASQAIVDRTALTVEDYPDWEDDEVARLREQPDARSDDGAIDLYTIDLDRPTTLVIETLGEADTVGLLANEHGVELATDDNSGVGSNFRLVVTLSSGRYLLGVARVGSSIEPYRLRVDPSPW